MSFGCRKMSHVEPLKTSSIAVYPLSSSSSRRALTVCNKLFSSCAGPHGKNHIVRNACGGHLTITSSCSRLLSSISFSRSELKLLVSAVNGHLQQCSDCGLFMIHVCLQLTLSVLDLDMHHSIISSTFLSFVSIIQDYIRSTSCSVRVRSDFSNVKILLSYVQSVLNSKILLNIQSNDLKDLSLTVLNAFVRAIPSVPTQRFSSGVFIVGQEKAPITESRCLDGIMVEFVDFSSDGFLDESNEKLKCRECADDEFGSVIKVALVTCSMSGDMDDVVNATYEGTYQQFSELQDCIFQKMISLCDALERQNVGLVLCQRVIHPKLKASLRSRRIIFVDRIGSQPIPFLRDLAGCQPITSIHQDVEVEGQNQFLGKLTSVSPCFDKDKSYICLQNSNSSIVTLLVCSEWEESLSELKHCVSACLKGLESLARDPWLLMGAGCWQMHCSHILKEQVLSTLPAMCEKLACSESNLRRLLAVFTSCLQKWCLDLKNDLEHLSVDTLVYHCWRANKNGLGPSPDERLEPCSCGFKSISASDLEDLDIVLEKDGTGFNVFSEVGSDSLASKVNEVVDYDNVVLDNLSFCMEALHKGVLTSGLLLSIGKFICDRN